MSNELENLKREALEATRLYLWYQGSQFSFHQGKTSKVEAERYKYLANYFHEEYLKRKGK